MKWFVILGLAALVCGCGTSELLAPKVLYTDAVDVSTTKGTFTIELFWSDSPLATTEFVRAVNGSKHVGRLFVPRKEKRAGLYEVVYLQVRKKDRQYRDMIVSRPPGFVRGTVGMIRVNKDETSPFHNYGPGFFICKKIRNPKLNLLNGTYTVVGQVIRGMEVVDRLGREDRILSTSTRRIRARHDGVLMRGGAETKESLRKEKEEK